MYLISPNDRLKGADEEVKYGLAESTVKTILPRVFAPTFSQMQDGSAMAGIETAEDFISFASLSLTANSN